MPYMEIKSYEFKFSDIYLVPIGDVHMGDEAFTKESRKKLEGYIDWVKKTRNAYIVLMGDLINVATLTSPTSPFKQNMNMTTQIENIVKLFTPVKDKILGVITGNHEQRLEKSCGYNPTITICDRLGLNNGQYLGASGVIVFSLHDRNFTGYFHHTTGGGNTIGGKMNRASKLREIIPNCDFYAGAHNHMLGCVHSQVYSIAHSTKSREYRIEPIRQMIIDTGGYLDYPDSYAEQMMLSPVKMGSPRIHLFTKEKITDSSVINEKDIHVSI